MAKELEDQGYPTALVSALPAFAAELGAPRIVRGVRIEHVCGDPGLSAEEDFALRCELFATALRSLQTAVVEPTIFDSARGKCE